MLCRAALPVGNANEKPSMSLPTSERPATANTTADASKVKKALQGDDPHLDSPTRKVEIRMAPSLRHLTRIQRTPVMVTCGRFNWFRVSAYQVSWIAWLSA